MMRFIKSESRAGVFQREVFTNAKGFDGFVMYRYNRLRDVWIGTAWRYHYPTSMFYAFHIELTQLGESITFPRLRDVKNDMREAIKKHALKAAKQES